MKTDAPPERVLARLLSGVIIIALFLPRIGSAGEEQNYLRITETFELAITATGKIHRLYLARSQPEAGLYLMEAGTGRAIMPIQEGWRFDSLLQISLEDIDTDSDAEMVLTASYYSGNHATAAQAFQHRSVLDFDQGEWRSIPVVMDQTNEPNAQLPGTGPHPVQIVENQKQLRMNGSLNLPEFDAVDFNRYRIASARILLTSGSMRIEDIRVFQTDNDYFVTYRVDTPEIGTTDIWVATLYVILPRDSRNIIINNDPAPADSLMIENVEAGVI